MLASLRWPPDWGIVALLSVLAAAGVVARERDVGIGYGVSTAIVTLAAGVALTGPGGGAIIGFLSYVLDFRSVRWRNLWFNAGMMGWMGGAGGLIYLALSGRSTVLGDPSPLTIAVQVAIPLFFAYAAMLALNTFMLGMMISLARRQPLAPTISAISRTVGWAYLLHVLMAWLFVILWDPVGVGPFSVVLILGPLWLTQFTLSRDARARKAHQETVSTLMGALELANPFSVGHSSRVADLCARMASRLEMRRNESDVLRYAALLHDLGLVATAPRLPRGSGTVDLTYLAAVVEHPEVGVRMLTDIDFLKPALPGILHHHERMDGNGYPAGLAGADIPLNARIIAVADAFDSLTTTRSYRSALDAEAAMERLIELTPDHLDPGIVAALRDSLKSSPWESTVIDDVVLQRTGDVYDHDDPEVSQQYAEWNPDAEEVTSS
ncbi:HD domain-containing protein [Ornithinimicrobium sp. Arc0846-15]|nr:HD domain-containing protein [Ornithinimicrobium laminariae]